MKLSSKGQLVIPKALRQALNLGPGDLLDIRVSEEGTIILDPIQTSALTALWGKYAGADFLGELVAEHREELSRHAGLRGRGPVVHVHHQPGRGSPSGWPGQGRGCGVENSSAAAPAAVDPVAGYREGCPGG